MPEMFAFLTNMVKLEMVASVLLLAISVSVVGVLVCLGWFIVVRLPGILTNWLEGLNAAVDKLADSVVRITADVAGTHQNTISAGSLLISHDAQAAQIKEIVQDLAEKQEDGNIILRDIQTTLKNRPCVVKGG